MNIEQLIKVGLRNKEERAAAGIDGPLFVERNAKRVLISNAHVAVVLDASEMKDFIAKHKDNMKFAESMLRTIDRDFNDKTADHALFNTTVEDLVAWLRKDTEPCGFCSGAAVCTEVQDAHGKMTDAELEKEEETADPAVIQAIEDSSDLHYGWIGPVALDRRLLDELLLYMEAPAGTLLAVHAMVNHRPHKKADGEYLPFYRAVKVDGPGWTIYVAGLGEEQEAAPKFHLEGKFTAGTFTAAKPKSVEAKPPTPKTKTKAAAKPATKQKSKAVPVKKAAPKAAPKPVAKAAPSRIVKSATKKAPAPTASSGSSILDRARAKKAAAKAAKKK